MRLLAAMEMGGFVAGPWPAKPAGMGISLDNFLKIAAESSDNRRLEFVVFQYRLGR